jgi:GxxExxY protein
MTEKLIHKNITEKILQSFFAVNKTLPHGLTADIYGNALAIEFEHNNLTVTRNYAIELKYRNVKIGSLQADFLIDEKVLVKVVSTDNINKDIVEDTKLLLRTSGHEVCMILNSLGDNEYKRIIFTNEYKGKKS